MGLGPVEDMYNRVCTAANVCGHDVTISYTQGQWSVTIAERGVTYVGKNPAMAYAALDAVGQVWEARGCR